MSALKRRKLSDSQGAKELLARKKKLWISVVFLKSRKHWKRVSCSQVTCIHTGIKITCVLVGWGEGWQCFSRPWRHTKDCFSSLLSYFATISLEDECLELYHDLGYLLMFALYQIVLSSLPNRVTLSLCFSLAGPICCLPWVPTAHLDGNLCHLPGALFTQQYLCQLIPSQISR